MQSSQRHPSNQRSTVPPVPTTLWQQLPSGSQQQLAHLIAELIQRVRMVASGKEKEHEC